MVITLGNHNQHDEADRVFLRPQRPDINPAERWQSVGLAVKINLPHKCWWE
uniref:Uncharacterized protein n=1 Tax=Arundo donax TaxID=35708 RepID=A0A0A9G374_ARUDO